MLGGLTFRAMAYRILNVPNGFAAMDFAIIAATNLTANHKILFCVINSLASARGYCYASNEYLSKLVDQDFRTIQRGLARLEEIGLIQRHTWYNEESKQAKRAITVVMKSEFINLLAQDDMRNGKPEGTYALHEVDENQIKMQERTQNYHDSFDMGGDGNFDMVNDNFVYGGMTKTYQYIDKEIKKEDKTKRDNTTGKTQKKVKTGVLNGESVQQHHSKKSEQAATETLFSKQERDITTTTPQIASAPLTMKPMLNQTKLTGTQSQTRSTKPQCRGMIWQ